MGPIGSVPVGKRRTVFAVSYSLTGQGGLVSAQPSPEMWQVKAACRGPQSEVFFPPPQFERKADRLEREARAKQICAECSVRNECLEYSLEISEPHGIWGGLNESERRALIESAS